MSTLDQVGRLGRLHRDAVAATKASAEALKSAAREARLEGFTEREIAQAAGSVSHVTIHNWTKDLQPGGPRYELLGPGMAGLYAVGDKLTGAAVEGMWITRALAEEAVGRWNAEAATAHDGVL